MPFANTAPLRGEIESRLPERPFTIEFWDGSRVPSTAGEGPTFSVRSPQAIAHALRAPGQLGLGRAYVSGELEVDDIDAVIRVLDAWEPPSLGAADKRALMLAAVRAMGVVKPPPRPAAELRPSGRRHSKERDARAVRHHYDVSNEFFELFLGPTMVYSCAIWRGGEKRTLEEAQEEKLDTVARKLAIKEGERVLDVGCGWGGFPLWAATKYGADVVGITLSPPQAERARQRAQETGVADRVDIRVMDYRDLAGTGEKFDAIASIGMVEHVGSSQIEVYAETLAGLLDSAGACSTTGSPASVTPTPRPGRSPSATSFPTPRRCTSRATCWRWNARASSSTTSRTSAPTTPRPWGAGPRTSTTTSRRRRGSPGPNGSASGASTFALPATASKAGSPTSTRRAAAGPEARS
jgi:cyclopropane-fatty-acyl-phospholipid synthase